MVIEAVKQMSGNQYIAGYEIKEATFSTPINISLNPNGLDTELYLRPLRDASDKNNHWFDFQICICENGNWAGVCHGMIKTEYNQLDATEVDEEKENGYLAHYFKEQNRLISHTCNKVADTRYVYQRLKEFGLNYGSEFQVLQQLRYSGNTEEALGVLTNLKRTTSDGIAKVADSYVIHPATLDGLLQLAFVGLTKGGIDQIPTLVASRINRLWVSSSVSGTRNHSPFTSYAKSCWKGYRVVECSMWALDIADQHLRIRIDGFVAMAVARASSQSAPEIKQVFYNIDWKPDLDTMSHQQIWGFCQRGRTSAPEPESFYHDLAFLLFYYIYNTLEEMGDLNVPLIHFQHYISWMRLQLTAYEAGTLSESHSEWKIRLQDPSYAHQLSKGLANYNKQGELYVEVGQNLREILSGTLDPLELLFADGLVKDFYEDLNGSSHSFEQLACYLDLLCHKNPGMEVLEVGAGTGILGERRNFEFLNRLILCRSYYEDHP